MAVSAEFRKGIAKSKEAVKRLTKAKKARPSAFETPDIPDGVYICRITVDADKDKNGDFYVKLNWIIAEGEYKNKKFFQLLRLQHKNEKVKEFAWNYLSKAIQILKDIGEEELEDFENWDLADVCDVLDEIDKEAPYARCSIKTRKDGEYVNLNMYINSLVDSDNRNESDDDETDESNDSDDSEESEEAEDEEESEESEDSEDSEESEDEEELEEVTIEKGDTVIYQRGQYTVLSSNKAKETCTLQHVSKKDKKASNVPWDKVTLVTD